MRKNVQNGVVKYTAWGKNLMAEIEIVKEKKKNRVEIDEQIKSAANCLNESIESEREIEIERAIKKRI